MRILSSLKQFILGRSSESWTDVILEKSAPDVIGWHIPNSEGLGFANIKLVNGEINVAYIEDQNIVELQRTVDGETVLNAQVTITSRIYSKINNILKKEECEIIPKVLFLKWESDIIQAQGKGCGTYNAARHSVKKKK